MNEKIIYIIIAVIWIVSSIIKAVGKKSNKTQSQSLSESAGNNSYNSLDVLKKNLEKLFVFNQAEMTTNQIVAEYIGWNETFTEKMATDDKVKYSNYVGELKYDFLKLATLEDSYFNEKMGTNRIIFLNDNTAGNSLKMNDDGYKNRDGSLKLFDEWFDLNKVVIYANIFKRPHY